MLQHRIGDSVWADGSEKGEVGGSCKVFTSGKGREERGIRLLSSGSQAKLRQETIGSDTQNFG